MTILINDGCAVIRNVNSLVIGETVASFRRNIRGLSEEGHERIVVDFACLSRIDSAGLAELGTCFAVLQNKRQALEFINVPEKIRAILSVVRLDKFC